MRRIPNKLVKKVVTPKHIAVIGIGRVGLPLALVLAKEGFTVTGVDVDEKKLNLLMRGKVPFMEEGAEVLLHQFYGKRLAAIHEEMLSTIFSDLDVVILTLGTTINETLTPDLSQVTDFFEKYSNHLRRGQLIVLRSTVSPGTTEYIANIIEKKTGLKVGRDIFIACCPERIAEGHAIKELYEIPQIIGVLDEKSGELAASVFRKLTVTVLFTNPRAAELAKLYCNMYRYIDFAIGNQFMLIAESHNQDIYEIMRLVNEGYKRGGLKGPGFTAGACLVKDGFFLIDRTPFLDLIAAAWRINESIPGFLVNQLKHLNHGLVGKKVALLGLAFKKNIDDTRYSLSLKMEKYLTNEGAEVVAHDPYVPSTPLEDALKDADIVVVAVNHDLFKKITLEWMKKIVKKSCLLCDIWNLFNTGKIIFHV